MASKSQKSPKSPVSPKSSKSILRLATFNVNSVRSRLPVLERWLLSLEKAGTPVDLLFLQETKAADADFPAAAFESMGYGARFCGEKSYNGVAVVSRASSPEPEVRFGFGDGEEPDFPTRVAYAKTSKIAILNTYVPQGKEIAHSDYAIKKRFLERVRAFFDREVSPGLPFAWVGDLNVAPAEIDVTHPENKRDHVCFHREIREKFQWVVSWGLSDVLRRFRPEEGEYTFFDYRVKDAVTRNVGWRIDHVLANEALAEKARACFVDREPRTWEKPSDHTPLVAEFEL